MRKATAVLSLLFVGLLGSVAWGGWSTGVPRGHALTYGQWHSGHTRAYYRSVRPTYNYHYVSSQPVVREPAVQQPVEQPASPTRHDAGGVQRPAAKPTIKTNSTNADTARARTTNAAKPGPAKDGVAKTN